MQLFRLFYILQLAAMSKALVVSMPTKANKKIDQQTSSLAQSYTTNNHAGQEVSRRSETSLSLSNNSDVSSSSRSTDATQEDSITTNNLLDRALNGDTHSVSRLLDTIGSLRENPSSDQTLENFLDDILEKVDHGRKPFWTRIRYTSKLSRRSRLAALHRLLNMSTPQAAAEENDTLEAKKSRRRRALVVALRSFVPKDKGQSDEKKGLTIYDIERAARKDLKEQSSAKDMESRLPSGLETPKYSVISKYPKYEIRNYESFSVCSVPMSKPRPDASVTDEKVSQPQLMGASSFGALAGYLFGKNEEQTAMKMTTPVLTVGEGDEREMSFVLPSTYWDEDSLSKAPTPLRNSLVQLKRDEGGTRAVVMFGGFASSKEVEAKKNELIKNLNSNKEWCIVPGSPLTLAQYNDPFTPPWKRRNEVSVLVQPSSLKQ
jgi:hypothetical protein